MNEYFKGKADAYREFADEELNANDISLERKAQLYDFLASCSSDEKKFLFLSGAFKDYMLDYLVDVLTVGLIDPRTRDEVKQIWLEVVDGVDADNV